MKYSPLSPKFKNRVATSTGSDVRTPHGGEMGRGNKNEKALQEKALKVMKPHSTVFRLWKDGMQAEGNRDLGPICAVSPWHKGRIVFTRTLQEASCPEHQAPSSCKWCNSPSFYHIIYAQGPAPPT
jgi:hypothetical protein